MDDKTYGLKSPRLKKIAVKIFGDIVENIFVADDYIQADKKRKLMDIENTILGESKEYLCYDASDLIIEFKNGNFVRFQNSEWAFMAKLEKTDFEII